MNGSSRRHAQGSKNPFFRICLRQFCLNFIKYTVSKNTLTGTHKTRKLLFSNFKHQKTIKPIKPKKEQGNTQRNVAVPKNRRFIQQLLKSPYHFHRTEAYSKSHHCDFEKSFPFENSQKNVYKIVKQKFLWYIELYQKTQGGPL